MAFPEPELLTSLVSRVFKIEDVTSGDPVQTGWVARYRGHLIVEDSVEAYDQLAESVKPYGLMPLFRKDKELQVVFLAPALPDPKKRLPVLNIVMFILTVFSVMLAGAQPEGPIPTDTLGQMLAMVKNIFTGWPFALALMGILLSHEFGHYLMSRHYKTAATLPFFIPLPFSPLGTMGAVIQMQGIPKNKRTLFDIGIAGPLAGLVVALPVLMFGLSISRLGVITDNVYPAVQDAKNAVCQPPVFVMGNSGPYTCPADNFLEGNSLLYLGAKYLAFGKLLPAPAATHGQSLFVYWLKYFFTGNPIPLGGLDVMIDPVAFAGWAGLLVTALNLIPAGMLDGGHVTYALFGDKVRKVFPFIVAALIGMGFFWSGWWLWAALLFWVGRTHAEPLDQITELDSKRRALGWFAIVIFVLVFTPVPMVLF